MEEFAEPEREPTEFGRVVLCALRRRDQSLRGLARATGVSFDRLKALLYGRYVTQGHSHALGSTFLLSGLYRMAAYLGIPAVELLVAFYGRDRETEGRASYLLDRFLRLDAESQAMLLSVLDSLLVGHEVTLTEEAHARLASLSLGRSKVVHTT